jgi:alginate O-acetyltransferase complex protein AlgI
VFLCLFLPAFLIVYFAVPRLRTVVLVAFSLAFYAYGEPVWVLALLLSGTVDYFNGRVIGRWPGSWQRRAALAASLALNLGILAVFKYSGFFVESLNAALGTSFRVPGFSLPLGISFYTFRAISYTIDVYRGSVKPQRSYLAFMSYVTMFPQLLAGPIVRYADIEERLTENRHVTLAQFSSGVTRFAVGLGKKALFSSAAGGAVNILLKNGAKLTVAGVWLGILFFAFQIYFDFSGYSDMAIGLGRMIGFEFRENFNYPYAANSVTDFWRRWHISLSTFFRDYVYIPLGGNRRHQMVNLLVVWFLTGLWHGAAWNFILWGLYYAVLLICEKLFLLKLLDRLPGAVRRVYALAAVLVSWGVFYFTSGTRLLAAFKAAIGIDVALIDARTVSVLRANALLLPVLIIACTPLPSKLAKRLREGKIGLAEPLFTGATLALSFVALVGQTYNPFLYFKF